MAPHLDVPQARPLSPPAASATTEILDIPERPFLMTDGAGRPGGSEFQAAIQGMYSVAYGVKFALKKRGIVTPTMAPMEALWDLIPDGDVPHWTLLIAQPDEAGAATVDAVRRDAVERKGVSGAASVRLEPFAEGHCAQILYVGPYEDEGPVISRFHRDIAERGYRLRGRHHEIYLNAPGRVAPQKLRTIIRQPVESV